MPLCEVHVACRYFKRHLEYCKYPQGNQFGTWAETKGERKLGICEIKDNLTSTAFNYSALTSRSIHRRKYLVNLRVAGHKKAWRTKKTLTVEWI